MGNSQSSHSESSASSQHSQLGPSSGRRNSSVRSRSRSTSQASTPRQTSHHESNLSPLIRGRSPASQDNSPVVSGARMVPIKHHHTGRNHSLSESPFVGSPLIQPDDLLLDTVAPRLASMSTSPFSSQRSSQHSRVVDSLTEENHLPGRQPPHYLDLPPSTSSVSTELEGSNLPQPDTFPNSLPKSRQSIDIEQVSSSHKERGSYVNPIADAEGGLPTLITWNSSAKNVYITGTFNGWKHKIPLNKSVNEFSTVLNFPPGIHHLKFIVDDEWKCSNDLLTATDQDGNLVNYIEVDDSSSPLYDTIGHQTDLTSTSPPGEYTKIIPESNQVDSSASQRRNSTSPAPNEPSSRPPLLPPHLEKVLLNSAPLHPDGPGKGVDEAWLLPVPNHVVLNHLYACSIRDGVMAVAGTSRYRNKYVTTIFYKPVVI